MGEHDGVQDLFFRDFVSAAFNHEDGVFRTGDDDIHVALFALGDGRVDDELAIDAADADTGNRPAKGIWDMHSDTDAPIIAAISGALSWSTQKS